MTPSHSHSGSSSQEEDAPESLSLSQSKKQVQKQDNVLKQIEAAEKQKKHARNKERDRRLKEQAKNSKKKKKDQRNGTYETHLELETAMPDAVADSDVDDSDNEMGFEGGSDEEGDTGNTGESSEGESEDPHLEQPPSGSKPKSNLNYLPDNLFISAFSQATKPSSGKDGKFISKRKKINEDDEIRQVRKRVRRSPKDLVIGSRVVRTLPQPNLAPSAVLTPPSAKVRRFHDRSLGLRGGNPRTRGWERRPANIGVLRRNGPAAIFARHA